MLYYSLIYFEYIYFKNINNNEETIGSTEKIIHSIFWNAWLSTNVNDHQIVQIVWLIIIKKSIILDKFLESLVFITEYTWTNIPHPVPKPAIKTIALDITSEILVLITVKKRIEKTWKTTIADIIDIAVFLLYKYHIIIIIIDEMTTFVIHGKNALFNEQNITHISVPIIIIINDDADNPFADLFL